MSEAETQETQENKRINFRLLIEKGPAFQRLKEDLIITSKLSLTGITNLVVNHEDPSLVDAFLKACFKTKELYNNTIDIDAVELQQGAPGRGNSSKYLDELIFGTVETEIDSSGGMDIPIVKIDQQSGKRKRKPDGFVNRKEVKKQDFDDKYLIIKNLDYCLDFCKDEPGEIDARALWIFDLFRNSTVRNGCRLILVTNKRIVLPFKIRTVEFPFVDDHEARHIINNFLYLYRDHKYDINFSNSQLEQIIRKLSGLTYTEAGDALGYALSHSEYPAGSLKIDSGRATKILRNKINQNFMEDGFGLTHLSSRPWEDYICPESSNFTFDVRKILRDFSEIKKLKMEQDKCIQAGLPDDVPAKKIEAVQMRMPHIFVLYGKGGVGKSAFPIHFSGLLDFDVWDFNINACHSKWIGEGSEHMRNTLKKITNATHLVVRVDEYDRAMGSTGESGQGMHEAHKQVESEFMNWLQNMQEDNTFMKQNIFVVLTTNHKENITGPLLRSGRADLVIDIDNFDAKSMKETFMTSARRMKNRGVKVIGFDKMEDLQIAIEKLDLDRLAELATIKGFTVRDVETFIMEMPAHDYYKKKGEEGLEWNNDNFALVLEKSQGSVRDDTTGELKLGDRFALEELKNPQPKDTSPQGEFPFIENGTNLYDAEKLKEIKGFKE